MRVLKDTPWEKIEWPLVRKRIFRLQRRIYEASKIGNKSRLYFLQNLLINSVDAKLLAVLQVSSLNQGRKTPGVDKKVATTGDEKLKIVKSLRLNGNAQPIRRVWIDNRATTGPKFYRGLTFATQKCAPLELGRRGKMEKRPLGIPTIRDRAKQAVAQLALEPEWEAKFEPNSYGFRPGRGPHDAIESISQNLCHNKPKWVYDADIQKCFDTINHEALLSKLNTFPAMKSQISSWLKAGVLEGYSHISNKVEPTIQGTPQGGIISPLLANIALHGLESHLKNFVKCLPGKPTSTSIRGRTARAQALGVVRYADNFVLTHANKQILELCVQETRTYLSQMSLHISEEKSALRDCREGFSFLGFQILQIKRKGKYSVKVYPTRKNQAELLLKIRSILQQGKSLSSYDLIDRLSPVIIGWARYYQYCDCSLTFNKLQHLIFQKLRAWVFRRDRRNGRIFIKEKYFPSNKTYTYFGVTHKSNWILTGQKIGKNSKSLTNFLPNLSWIPSQRFVKVSGTSNEP